MLNQHEKLVPDLFQSILKTLQPLIKQKDLARFHDSDTDEEKQADAMFS